MIAKRNIQQTKQLIEKTARSISNWKSENDWPEYTDEAIRCIKTIKEYLEQGGYNDAALYLNQVLDE